MILRDTLKIRQGISEHIQPQLADAIVGQAL